MAATSRIEWTDATWNPLRGCTKVSPGCKHCYAESGPEGGDTDAVDTERFKSLIHEAHALGCRQIQFIGGEPMKSAANNEAGRS